MKIINGTKWKTADLTRFVEEIARREFLSMGTRGGTRGQENYDKTTITFVLGKERKYELSGIHGDVRISACRVRIWMNRVADKYRSALAMVIAHEFRHIQTGGSGRKWERKHRGMDRYGYRGNYLAHYAEFDTDAYPLTWYGKKRKEKPAAVAANTPPVPPVAAFNAKLRQMQAFIEKQNEGKNNA